MQQYRIVPVFPPREDIQLGDVYLSCLPPKSTDPNLTKDIGTGPTPIWVASIPNLVGQNSRIGRFYKSRLAMPVTTNAVGLGTDSAANGKIALRPVPSNDSLFVTGTANRLRSVSFPEFFSVSASGGSVGALFPTPAVLAGIGITAEDVESASVSIPAGESYGLPLVEFDEALQDIDENANKRINRFVGDLKKDKDYCDGELVLIGVSEIFAARAIDVRMNFKSSAAAKANVALSIDPDSKRGMLFNALKAQFAPTSKPQNAQGGADTKQGTSQGEQPKPSIDQSTAFLRELNQLAANLEDVTRREHPGVGISFFAGTSAGVTMIREFANPVVVGYRGVRLAQVPNSNGGFRLAAVSGLVGIPPIYLAAEIKDPGLRKKFEELLKKQEEPPQPMGEERK